MGALGDASAAQALISVLSEPHVPTVLVVEVLDALGALRAPGSFDVLLELLSDRSPAVRAAALAAAAKVDPSAFLVVVSGMGFSAALAIFFLIGAIWLPALICVGVTVVFLFLMFFIERGAEAADKR